MKNILGKNDIMVLKILTRAICSSLHEIAKEVSKTKDGGFDSTIELDDELCNWLEECGLDEDLEDLTNNKGETAK